MAELARKSMANVNLTIGGIDISTGGGENDFIAVTSPEQFATKTGSHGDGVAYDSPNNWYEATLTLLETAGANEDLQGLYNAQVSSTSQGPYDFQLEDVGTKEELAGQAIFIKQPDRGKSPEAANYEWRFNIFAPDGWQYRSRGAVVP